MTNEDKYAYWLKLAQYDLDSAGAMLRFILSQIETELSISVPAETYGLIDALSAYYLNNRYPDFVGQSGLNIDKATATHLLEKTREVFTWLLTLKQSTAPQGTMPPTSAGNCP